jgi:hypothetical protein
MIIIAINHAGILDPPSTPSTSSDLFLTSASWRSSWLRQSVNTFDIDERKMQCSRGLLGSRGPKAVPTAQKAVRFQSNARSVAVRSLREDDHSLLRQLCGPGAAMMLVLLLLHLPVLLVHQYCVHQVARS